ncbi:TPA: MarR family transcriptional regulator [Candidatus Scatousia excrementigallinarum]|uniref:MarR family transcriptional regulator n=1 Tax=Candidatus Scatousia excrementigallinarum TaxID=2840935 RepID=A0A9D1JMN4_9BACT|nr:MarR family transcriptional regulator [Candidatus Scatousia excrementigallinarum]
MNTKKHYTDSIYYDIELTARIMKLLGTQVFENLKIGITPEEHAALDTIFCHPGICQRDLAKLILKDRANTGRILHSLESKNLITRTIDMKNNRLIKKMIITDEGNKKLEETNDKVKLHLQNVSCKFREEEIYKLQETLRAFRKNLEELVNMNI